MTDTHRTTIAIIGPIPTTDTAIVRTMVTIHGPTEIGNVAMGTRRIAAPPASAAPPAIGPARLRTASWFLPTWTKAHRAAARTAHVARTAPETMLRPRVMLPTSAGQGETARVHRLRAIIRVRIGKRARLARATKARKSAHLDRLDPNRAVRRRVRDRAAPRQANASARRASTASAHRAPAAQVPIAPSARAPVPAPPPMPLRHRQLARASRQHRAGCAAMCTQVAARPSASGSPAS